MPTYQYACTECGHQFEAVQSFSEDALTDCPQCTGRLRKVFNTVGIVFKGSGFYRTDSRPAPAGGSGSPGSTKDGTSETTNASGDSAASGSKPKAGTSSSSTSPATSGSATAGTAA